MGGWLRLSNLIFYFIFYYISPQIPRMVSELIFCYIGMPENMQGETEVDILLYAEQGSWRWRGLATMGREKVILGR